jgi:hypothetical protein
LPPAHTASSPFESAPRGLEGEIPPLPLARRRPGAGGARGGVPARLGCARIGAEASFAFFPGRLPSRARAAPALGVRASRAARPRAPPRAGWRGWTGGAARLARLTGAVVKEIRERKGEERELTSGAHAAVKEKGKGGAAWVNGPKGSLGWAAASQGEKNSAQSP